MAREGVWRTVGRGELQRAPGRFSFSFPALAATLALRSSLERFGLLRPPLVTEETGTLHLVAGHRRLGLLEEFGVQCTPVRVVSGRPASELWDLLLEDQLVAGPLNPVEIGRYARLRLAATGESPETLTGRVLPRLGLPPKPEALEDPLWVAGLPQRHCAAFAEGRLPIQGVRVLAQAPREDALAVLDLVAGARIGVNKFSELARWVLECAWGEGVGVKVWIQNESLALAADDLEGLRRQVRRRRHPRLSQWETAFAKDIRAAQLPENVRITHPRGFEGSRFACSTTFSGLRELDRALTSVREALRAGRLDSLTRYLE